MLSRAAFILITLFWLAMNVLLWRSEYGGRDSAGAVIPAAVVWQKILTAPDSSSLTILHHGKKVGFCHWVTGVGEALSRLNEADVPPEGLLHRVNGYCLQLEGNLVLENVATRLRFDSSLKLATNQLWQEFNARLNFRPTIIAIHSVAADQTIRLQAGEGTDRLERVIKFSELRHPAALISQFGPPLADDLWASLELPAGAPDAASLASGLRWEARNDLVKIGHAQVRAYRLQARFLDRYQAVIFVSRVGEILRVELPDEIMLINDQLANF